MLHLIRNLLKNFFRISEPKDSKENKETVASIHFDLHKDNYISIKCYTPDIEDMSDDDIATFAEDYAHLLSNVNDGVYNQSIVKIIKDNIDHNNPKEVLLFNNILAFWSIFHVDNKKNYHKNQTAPLIKPTQVFKRS